MALLKDITDNRGITTNYHKIIDIQNMGNIAITVRSYVSKEIRDKEIEATNKINRFDYLVENRSEDTEEFEELALNQSVYAGNMNLGISDKTYTTDSIDDFSFQAAYNYLKTLSDFENAEDVL